MSPNFIFKGKCMNIERDNISGALINNDFEQYKQAKLQKKLSKKQKRSEIQLDTLINMYNNIEQRIIELEKIINNLKRI